MDSPSDPPPDQKNGRVVGRVVALWRYPVKSMGAEGLDETEVGWHGLAGDRRWAFVRDGIPQSGFPWLTIRQRANMGHYRPRFLDPADPDGSPTSVQTPDGRAFDVTDPALAAELAPGARVIRQSRGVFDTFPLSLLSTGSVAGLGALMGLPPGAALDPQRFRPNLLVEGTDGAPFAEDAWVGAVLSIGGAQMRVDKRDGRCAVVNVDPATSHADPAVLRTIAREREGCMGIYGTTVQPGRVAVGDAVVLV
ncbi:MAG TPA: MOSC domain-containing protein [Rhodothermales bacterium]|nr:MOSC domain-containing protein [Rhodothermales bacterium]